MAIPQAFIDELLTRVDVVDVIGRYMPLRKSGASFTGLCPFHTEKSPSFNVIPAKQFYHCFGCGKSGNAIGFLMEHASLGFREAVQELAQQTGLQVPEDDTSPGQRARAAEQRQKEATLGDVLERAGAAWRRHLKNAPRAVQYLKGRGLSGVIAKRFGLGYAPEGWRGLASVFPNYDDPLLVESGLVIAAAEDEPGGDTPRHEGRRYDRFRDRIMFPIRNVKGECIGFGGRVLGDEKPKYLNSPETPVFSKGRELYGLFEARTAIREAGYALVTEGYMDVVALAQLGFPNAVATLGTACTPEHVRTLLRFTDSVVFSFDGDAAGRRAARKALDGALPHASDVRSIKFLFLPPEHDPDSYIRAFGHDAFARCVAEALPLSRFLLEAAAEALDLASTEGRAHLAANARPLWSALPEGALKRQLLGQIAEQVQLDAHELEALWAASGADPGAARNRYQKDSNKRIPDNGYSPKTFENPAPWRPLARRARPAGRTDHAARLLLAHAAHWEQLPHEDHALLCALPAPHGALFTWLDGQIHEHGPLPWGTLAEALPPEDEDEGGTGALARRLMAGALAPVPGTPASEAWEELRALLDLARVDWLKQQETEALSAGDLARYQRLHAQRKALIR